MMHTIGYVESPANGPGPGRRALPPVTLSPRVTYLFIGLPESNGFLLAGGAALRASELSG